MLKTLRAQSVSSLLTWRNLCLWVAIFCAFAPVAGFAQQRLGSLKADRILFLGNSVTLHGARPEIGWTFNWGMGASAPEKDYVHLLSTAINRRIAKQLVIERRPATGAAEIENVLNIAGILEREYATYESGRLRKQLAWKPDLVIIQCGENVVANGFDREAFHRAFRQIVTDLKSVSNPHIFITSSILSHNPALDEIKQQLCAEDPAHRTFVDLGVYRSTEGVVGFASHPNDLGMQVIADALFAAICRKAGLIPLSAEHLATANRRRRIYVNNDVGYDAAAMGPRESMMTPADWLAARFSTFDQPGSQVDCIGWCVDEGNIAAYPSRVLPELQYPTLLRWRREGVDIVQKLVEESHRRNLEAFWEHRLNGADREVDVTTPARHPLKEQHPDWLLEGSWWKPGLWNFAVPEVRQYKLAVLREVAERYDFDGISLDFGRHPPFLPVGRQWEQRDALTDFVRQVRLMLQEVAARRNRPCLLAVRVADTVPGCHFDGIDIETWVGQNLIDQIVIGTRSIQVDLAGFRKITAGSHVRLYPCLDQHHSPDGYHAVAAPEFLRGVAANWWSQGADGIATFNFWNELPDAARALGTTGPLRGAESVHALAYRELGDPRILEPLDKWFVVARRYGGGFYDRQGNRWNDYTNLSHQAPLPLVVGGDPAWVEVDLADDLSNRAAQVKTLELRLQFSPGLTQPDPEVKINGVLLRAPIRDKDWWNFALSPAQLATGRNLVTISRAPSSDGEPSPRLEKVEIHVRYQPAPELP